MPASFFSIFALSVFSQFTIVTLSEAKGIGEGSCWHLDEILTVASLPQNDSGLLPRLFPQHRRFVRLFPG